MLHPNSRQLQFPIDGLSSFGPALVAQHELLLQASADLSGVLRTRTAESKESIELVWPPKGMYRQHFEIAEGQEGSYQLAVNEDLSHPISYRVGVSAGQLAARSVVTSAEIGVRPLMLDEITSLTYMIGQGRSLKSNEIADRGRTYTSRNPRWLGFIFRELSGAND